MAIKSTLLDSTPTTVFQSIDSSAITSAYFCNTSAGPVTFNLYLVPSGQTADPVSPDPVSASSNIIYYAVQIAPSDTYVVDTEKIIFENGDSLVASASLANFVVATISTVGI